MRRSKSQVLYNALPGAYVSYSSGPYDNVVIKISYWKTTEMDISDKDKITSQIIPDILAFQNNEFGSVDEKLLNLISDEYREKVKFVEVKLKKDDKNKKDAQIYGNIDPKLFYCSECGEIKYAKKNSDIKNMKCTNDKCSRKGKTLYQYNRVFVCECGESYPIFVDTNKYRYFADGKDGFYNVKTKKTEKIPFTCENCGRNCILINATDPKAFFPRIITSVKLTEDDYPDLCNSEEGRNLIIDYYIGEKGRQEFESCANDLKKEENSHDYFDEDDDTESFNLKNIIDSPPKKCSFDENAIYKILEYNSLRGKIITDMKTALQNAVKYNEVSSEEEINSMLKKLKIANMFSVGDIEIINTAYAYTRRYQSFEEIEGSSKVKLRAFENKRGDSRPVFYNIKTKTEGIVIDIDKREIYNYLKYKFGDKYRFKDYDDEKDLCRWFLNKVNIDSKLVKKFEDIDIESGSFKSLYTQCVYQLLHTISHMFINTISKYCGIDKSSLSEMIFLNACSILIYSQTSQGAVLGALSQTFDKNLYNILKHTYDDNSVCAFDPLCMDTSNGSCCACSYLDEVACEHFNKDLSRRLLYGYKSADGNCDVKGFWEDM